MRISDWSSDVCSSDLSTNLGSTYVNDFPNAGRMQRVTVQAGHSSATHRGVNAISAAAELVLELERIAAGFRDAGPFDSAFDPPYTTLNIGTIEGGAAVNIIARRCALRWETRPLPADDPAPLVARLYRSARAAPQHGST